MIYMKAGDQVVVVLEPSNLEKMKDGQPIVSPDKAVLIAYCPDVDWLTAEIAKVIDDGQKLDVGAFDKLLKDGLDRPTVYRSDAKMKRII